MRLTEIPAVDAGEWSRISLNSQPNCRFGSAYSIVPVFQSFTLFRSSVASRSRVNTRTICRNRALAMCARWT